jgi:hypothetical protein
MYSASHDESATTFGFYDNQDTMLVPRKKFHTGGALRIIYIADHITVTLPCQSKITFVFVLLVRAAESHNPFDIQ